MSTIMLGVLLLVVLILTPETSPLCIPVTTATNRITPKASTAEFSRPLDVQPVLNQNSVRTITIKSKATKEECEALTFRMSNTGTKKLAHGGFGVTSLRSHFFFSNRPITGTLITGKSSNPSEQVDRRRRDASLDNIVFYEGNITAKLRRKCVRTGEVFKEIFQANVEGGVCMDDAEGDSAEEEGKEVPVLKGVLNRGDVSPIGRDDGTSDDSRESAMTLPSEVTVELPDSTLANLIILSNDTSIILNQWKIDVGELAVQEICVQLDPYPKKEGTEPVDYEGNWH